jgi:cytidine deaminase
VTDAELLALADAAAARAYAPYSTFLVGAALLDRDGRVWEGVNVENASYSLGVCAERSAIARAVSTDGRRPGDFEAIAITASPCGGCRQWLVEFRLDRVVYRDNHGDMVTRTPDDLLPDTFEL